MDNSLLDSLSISEAVQMIVDYAAGLSDSDVCFLLNSLTVSDACPVCGRSFQVTEDW